MSDKDKNETEYISKDKLFVKEGDIVWHIEDKCICEVISVRPQLKPKPVIYIMRIAGNGFYNSEPGPDEVELLLPKEQIQYEVITSNNTIKAFYKGKMVLDLAFELKKSIPVISYALSTVKRHYIYNQLLEMYPDTKISEVIIKNHY